MRKIPCSAICLFFLLLLGVVFSHGHSTAHHTSSIAYIHQEVGKMKTGNLEIQLNAMPPRLINQRQTPESIERAQKFLSRFTHRFEMRI